MKKTILTLFVLFAVFFPAAAQLPGGGVKGTVVDRADRSPVANARVEIFRDGNSGGLYDCDVEGKFLLAGYDDGDWSLLVMAPGYLPVQINITIAGAVRDLFTIGLTPIKAAEGKRDDSEQMEFDLADTGYSDAPTVLFANDVYSSIAGYSFGSVRFKNRGYNSETQDVLLSGVSLNDALTGYSPWSLWSGLNEITRSKASTLSMEASDFALGGYNGVTNIFANPSSVRSGLRVSALTNSAMYRLRLMLSSSWLP